jgi:GlpG protein
MTASPLFGGMSGVVYGLLGYVWGQGFGRSDLGFSLNRSTVVMMLVWYALCWTGLLGPIANWAHTAGLIVGVGWGYISASAKK